jgi:hypothetical protein
MLWLYCRECGWQTEEPETIMDPKCPECRARLMKLEFSKIEYARYKEEMEKGIKEFVKKVNVKSYWGH